MKKVLAGIIVAVMVMGLAGTVFAADWPTGTVNVVLPYGAGGDTDTYCRQLFQRVSKITGQTFVVINQQGGSDIVAAMDVMNKPNNGCTLLFKPYGRGSGSGSYGHGGFLVHEGFRELLHRRD